MTPNGEPSQRTDIVLSARDLTKRYPGVVALDDVSLDVRRGTVHTLVGQNGAGKSTLVRCLVGAVEPDHGQVVLHGDELPFGQPHVNRDRGVAYVSQEGNVNPLFSVPENVFLGRELTRYGFVAYGRMRAAVEEVLERYDLQLDLRSPVGELNPAERKLTETVRALSVDPQVLILDEPTAALPRPDVDHLLSIVRHLASRGMAVIFISHHLGEVLEVSDDVTILRNGEAVWTGAIEDIDRHGLVERMIGRELTEDDLYPELPENEEADAALEVRDLRTSDRSVRGADLTVRCGEVLGIFGLVGAGKSELLEAIFGLRPTDAGTVRVGGQRVRRGNPRASIASGLALVPEDRLEKSLLADRSIAWNVTVPFWSNMPFVRGLGRREQALGESVISRLDIEPARHDAIVATLSGGNKQKVSIGRWAGDHADVKVFLLDEPTQGLDVEARAEVYRLMADLCASGAAVVVASSDVDEVLGVSHRTVVMERGKILELDESQTTRADVLERAS